MIGEEIGTRSESRVYGCVYSFAIECIIILAIIEFIVNAAADFKVVVGCYRSVTRIEKPMEVRSKQNAIVN